MSTSPLRASWLPIVEESRERAPSNVSVQGERLGELVGTSTPDELGERLAGIDSAAAEAIVVLPEEEAAGLVVPLAAAVSAAAPLLGEEPADVVDALIGLVVVSCWNDVLLAGRGDRISGPERTEEWLDRVSSSPAADDWEVQRRLTFAVAATAREPLLRELVDSGFGDAPVPQPEGLAPVLAAAVLEGRRLNDLEAQWDEWLAAAPDWLRTGALEWQDLLWAARAVYARVGGSPLTEVVPALRGRVFGD